MRVLSCVCHIHLLWLGLTSLYNWLTLSSLKELGEMVLSLRWLYPACAAHDACEFGEHPNGPALIGSTCLSLPTTKQDYSNTLYCSLLQLPP